MAELGQYILSVVSAAVIAGIVSSITSVKSTTGTLIRMICGLFLAFTVIAPLGNLNYDVLTAFSQANFSSADAAAAHGEELAQDALREIIKEKTEAYILDKAAAYHTELFVEVTLSTGDYPVPEQVLLRGSISSYAKQRLQGFLETELGIPKEHQQWIS